ncbi:MAG: hypothetical protein LZF86_110736 [Nitrospira sp.]|nr:MAG: hypothetical protein LZF86_110736 [Nitrospira sp.]
MSKRLIMMRGLLRKFLGTVSILLITLILLEVAVRIWGYAQPHIYDPIYRPYDRPEDLSYIHKPNLVNARARGLALINTDSLGLRAKIAGALHGAKQPNEYRIALIGDSYTFGEGVARTDDTFAQVLEDRLNQRRRAVTVKTFNFGASAYSVKEMVATLRYRTLDIQPDLVVMAIITSDFNLARTPTIDAEGYLIDQELHRFSPSGSMITRVLRQVHLVYVLRGIGVRWFFPSPDIGQMISQGYIPEAYAHVRQFKTIAEERGLPCVVMLLPRMRTKDWGAVVDQLTRDRIAYIDFSSVKNEFSEEQFRASRFDSHPSAAVHHRIGESLADYVQRQPWFPQ